MCQNNQKLWNIYTIKKILFCLCIKCIKTYSIKTWKKNDVEAINYDGKKWINRTQLGNALGYSNIAPRTQYYSSKFKRKRYETQDCEDYEPCRMFLKEELAVTIIMDTRKTNQLYLGLNLKSINTIQS